MKIQNFKKIKIDIRGNIKFALIDEFHRNQCQNKVYSLYFQEKLWNTNFRNFRMVFHDFEYHQDFRKIHKILKMVKYARCSSREKLAFASVGTKPAGGELVLELVSIEKFCFYFFTNFSRFFIFGPWKSWKNQWKTKVFCYISNFLERLAEGKKISMDPETLQTIPDNLNSLYMDFSDPRKS